VVSLSLGFYRKNDPRWRKESLAVIDANGQLVGQLQGGWGAQKADRWLRSLGFRPAAE
jgi:hypothetical protein